MEVLTFTCSICGETSHKICVYCTKDACANHLCERCHRCSDCCQCEMRRFVEGDLEHNDISIGIPEPVPSEESEPEPVEA